MSLTATASGFVVFLLSLSVVQGQNDGRVTYSSTQICALKGSTVEISCTHTYQPIFPFVPEVVKTLWFTRVNQDGEPVDLKTVPEYSGRVQYSSNNNDCTLRISDLRESDSAEYKFRFITNHDPGGFTGTPGVTLSVTDLQVQVSAEGDWRELTCDHSCLPAAHPSVMWFKNGQKIHENALIYYPNIDPADSFSCALKGYEAFSSPSLHAPTLPSVSVSPSEIVEGISVTLTCSSDANPAANYTWYKEKEEHKPLSKEPKLVFSSIQSSDSGKYLCAAENQLGRRTSGHIFINVKCNYSTIMNIIRLSFVVLMLIPLLLLSLSMRKKKTQDFNTEPDDPVETELDSCPAYANISVTAAKTEDSEEQEELV